jgi:hypothetical protein
MKIQECMKGTTVINNEATAFLKKYESTVDTIVINSNVNNKPSLLRINKNSELLFHENGQPIYDENGNEIDYD